MNTVMELCAECLTASSYEAEPSEGHLLFENATNLGFLFVYPTPSELLASWKADSDLALKRQQFRLRNAGDKAWNVYVVLLSESTASASEAVSLSAIEEDLIGTRKLARAGIKDAQEVIHGLLPLLPVQNATQLEPIDMVEEVKLRAPELPARVLQAFLSNVEESVVIRVLEETQ